MILLLTILIEAFVLSAVLCRPDSAEDAFYQKIFEEIDVDVILDNERLIRSYLNCFFDEGPCKNHQDAVKKSIPEVMSTVCGKCSLKQKQIFHHCLNKFIPTHKEDWEHILRIYDPTGEYWPNVKIFMEGPAPS